MRHAVICIRTEEMNFSNLPCKEFDWKYSVYGDPKEEIPSDMPTPRGKRIVTTSFVDANLYHDLVSGKSVTGILHFFNKTPIDWFSKLQSTVETATFGSEYVAARTCTEQIINLRMTLRYLGKLQKRHNALSFHRTRYTIAAGITRFYHIRGNTNPADILSKHWEYRAVWPMLRSILFWRGDTAMIKEE